MCTISLLNARYRSKPDSGHVCSTTTTTIPPRGGFSIASQNLPANPRIQWITKSIVLILYCHWLGFEMWKTTRKRKCFKAEILSRELAPGSTIRRGSESLQKSCGRRGWQSQDLERICKMAMWWMTIKERIGRANNKSPIIAMSGGQVCAWGIGQIHRIPYRALMNWKRTRGRSMHQV